MYRHLTRGGTLATANQRYIGSWAEDQTGPASLSNASDAICIGLADLQIARDIVPSQKLGLARAVLERGYGLMMIPSLLVAIAIKSLLPLLLHTVCLSLTSSHQSSLTYYQPSNYLHHVRLQQQRCLWH